MEKHTLKKSNGHFVLYKDGNKTYCMKSPLVPEQDSIDISVVKFNHLPCSSGCPFHTVTKLKDKNGKEFDASVLRCMEKPFVIKVEIEEVKHINFNPKNN